MPVAALVLVKDEADIIEHTVRHLLGQVDRVYATDNLSTDGTTDILHGLRAEFGTDRVRVGLDEEVGYWQSRKTTELAMVALEDGFDWAVPCDGDEFWYAPDGRRIAQVLDGLAPDVQIVNAPLYDHVPSAADPPAWCPVCGADGEVFIPLGQQHVVHILRRDEEGTYVLCPRCAGEVEQNPFRRIRWRKRDHGVLGKVAVRLRPDVVIHAGNHSASTSGTGLTSGGLEVRHFSWRSAEQYIHKIRNGQAAYAATNLPEDTGRHWRMWEEHPDETLADHFRYWFWSVDPHKDSTLMFDPAPGA